MYYIYVLRCIDETLYTGIASDVKRRFSEHCLDKNKGAKYTKSHRPKRMEAIWSVDTRSQALRIESYIKKKTRADKLKLIAEPEILNETFPKSDTDSEIRTEAHMLKEINKS